MYETAIKTDTVFEQSYRAGSYVPPLCTGISLNNQLSI